MFNINKKSFELGGKELSLETGKLARQADGAVVMQSGESIVLVTVVASKEPRKDLNFLPLTIEVSEKMYAAGKIPGGFFKREGRPSEKAILTARLIDRPLRPNFPKGFNHEIQVVVTTLSVDQVNPPDILALNAASAALSISDIPFTGPIGAVRIGRINNEWVINPTFEEIEASDIDLVLAGSREAISMVEAGAKEVSEPDMLAAMEFGHEAIKKIIDFQIQFATESTKEKFAFAEPVLDSGLEVKVRNFAAERLDKSLRNPDKLEREIAVSAIKSELIEDLGEEFAEKEKDAKELFNQVQKELVRKMIIAEQVRVDGRKLNEIRPIASEVGVLPRTHGSGLFTRGQTQAISILTLGTMRESQTVDGIGVEESKRYMHHYNFPPFCVGETGRMLSPKRREIGHGALAERALLPVIPVEESFPYSIRVVSEVLESNGSSSQASICGSTLALMDAGVPITAPVAGIAMGLVKEEQNYAILSDIQGIEDALGDMDFKVAGTSAGITALQMDMKVAGVGWDILKQALQQAHEGRLFILDKMAETISEPRPALSPTAPRIIIIKIPTDKIREVIGPGGKIIQGIIAETGCKIDIEDDGTIYIASVDGAGGDAAKRTIEGIIKDVEPGDVFNGKVVKIMPFGAFVQMKPGREGLVHISKLANRRVEKVEDVVNEGDVIPVKVLEIDKQNRVRLTAVDVKPPDNE